MGKVLWCILFIFLATDANSNNEIKGRVTAVHDGNTLEIITGDKEIYKIVLQGIDCPETGQEYSAQAKNYLEKLAFNQEVIVHIYGKDRLKNYIAIVLLKDGTDIRYDLLKAGLAWTAEKGPLPELEVHREIASEERKGLWKQDAPTAPWIYRRQQSMLQPKSR